MCGKDLEKKKLTPIYKGYFENGKPNGVGIMTYPDGAKYVGGWKNGEKHGQGTFTYPDG